MFFRKLLVVALVLALGAVTANAFTVVLRSGRQVEIPNTFTLTKSGLTYETAPGIQVTIQLASIDIAATERINGQPAGSFLMKATEPQTAPVRNQRPTATRSITNQDLEGYRRARIASEQEYERTRKQLGLPSREERRRELEEIEDRTQEQIERMRSQEELTFWKNRATQLEAQMTGAQINILRDQINEAPWGPWAYPHGAFSTPFPFAFPAFGGFPFGGFPGFGDFKGHFRGGHFKRPLLFKTPRFGAGINFSTPRMRPPVFHNPGRGHGFRGRK